MFPIREQKIKGGTKTNHAKESNYQEKRGDGEVSLWKRACLYSIRKKGKIVANSNSQEDSYFTDGGFELIEGNAITDASWDEVLIHEKFAQRNGLIIGDTILLGDASEKAHTIPVTVAGIFTNTKEQDSIRGYLERGK